MKNIKRMGFTIVGAWVIAMTTSVVNMKSTQASLITGNVENKAVNKVVREGLVPTLARVDGNVQLLLGRQNAYLTAMLKNPNKGSLEIIEEIRNDKDISITVTATPSPSITGEASGGHEQASNH